MYYAGSKFGQNANPKSFMIEGGYCTSSKKIKSIIEEAGINVFIIRKLKVFSQRKEAFDYETKFLQRINARKHKKFYNTHNNDGKVHFGSKEFCDSMMQKYGNSNAMQVEIIKTKAIANMKGKKKPGVSKYNKNRLQPFQDKKRPDHAEFMVEENKKYGQVTMKVKEKQDANQYQMVIKNGIRM